MLVLLAACAVGACPFVRAGTWYVDAANYGQPGLTGATPESAYGTIQEAIEAETTLAEDIIEVKPGVYDQGVRVDSLGSRNRVLVTKKLTIRSSTGVRDSVVVVGAKTVGATLGLGADSIRCIGVEPDAAGSVIQGFVLRGGSTATGSDSCAVSGGGIVYLSPNKGASGATYLVDSTIADCSATRGGGIRSLVMIRCLVTGCAATQNCSAGRQCKSYNSVFFNNDSSLVAVGYASEIVNCTFYGDCGGQPVDSTDALIANTVLLPGGDFTVGDATAFSHCATSLATLPGSDNVTGETEILIGPAVEDIRLRSASLAAGGKGDVSALSKIPSAYRDVDFYGNPRKTGDTVNIGAVETAVAPAAGKMVFSGVTRVQKDWKMTVDGHPVWSSYLYPTQWPTQLCVGVESAPSGFAVMRYDITLDGTTFQSRTPPSMKDDSLWLMPHPTKVKSVTPNFNPIRYVDAANYGKANLDGSTRAKAYGTIQDAIDAGSGVVIKVFPGTYDKGGSEAGGMSNRVSVTLANYRIVSTDGATATVIRGAADTSTADGVGDGAVRCAYFTSACALQGFTLTDSHPRTKGEMSHGAFYGTTRGTGGFLADSIVSNNYGSVAGLYCGTAVRTLFAENHSDGTATAVAIRSSIAANCIFRDNDTSRNSHNDTRLYNCTVCEKKLTEQTVFAASGVRLYNNIYSVAKNVTAGAVSYMGGCVFDGGTYANGKDGTFVYADPRYAWEAAGDFRLRPGSPALGQGVTSHDDFSDYATGDFYGNPYAFADGRPAAGAVHTALPQATRYVSAADGSDDNDGLSAGTPKATLAAALAACSPLDTVRVAPGTYSTGEMLHPVPLKGTDTPTVRSRAVLPVDVTLQATGSAAETVLVGGESVRCVVLNSGATIRGFTLRDGRTGTANAETDDNLGGGVLADDSSSVAEDCIITGCASVRGGGSYRGTFRRCRFFGNSATKNGTSGRQGHYYGCHFDGGIGPDDVYYPQTVNGCTFGAGTRGSDASLVPSVSGTPDDTIVNTLVLSACPTALPADAVLDHCAYPTTLTTVFATPPADCVVADPQDLQVDATGRPVVGGNAAIDGADETGYDAATMGDADLSGFQRTMNGRMDIGAYEADWRPAYASTLGRSKYIEVTAASPAVRRENGSILVPDGSVALTLTRKGNETFSLTFHVTGNGVLTLLQDGTAVASWTSADGNVVCKPSFDDSSVNLAFSYAPGTDDAGVASLDRIARNAGCVFLIR